MEILSLRGKKQQPVSSHQTCDNPGRLNPMSLHAYLHDNQRIAAAGPDTIDADTALGFS